MKAIISIVAFLALFLGIGGASLYLTPRLAAWIDKKRAENTSETDEDFPKQDQQEGE